MPQHLLMRLEGPLMSFGSVAVDHLRPVQPWPAVSMLTGLLGNALGWHRSQGEDLDRLQARIRWAARWDRRGTALNDFQTAQLSKDDQGWTTRGVVEGREGGANTYLAPHLRSLDYRADAAVTVALRLEPADENPTLTQLAQALDEPLRPLFLGRKACLPSTRVSLGMVEAADAVQALQAAPAGDDTEPGRAIYFNRGAAPVNAHHRVHEACDERRFSLDVHAGRVQVFEIAGGSPP